MPSDVMHWEGKIREMTDRLHINTYVCVCAGKVLTTGKSGWGVNGSYLY